MVIVVTSVLAIILLNRLWYYQEIAEKTAEGWRAYNDMAFAHFDFLKSRLDKTDASYRD